jgi:hypothetical protein
MKRPGTGMRVLPSDFVRIPATPGLLADHPGVSVRWEWRIPLLKHAKEMEYFFARIRSSPSLAVPIPNKFPPGISHNFPALRSHAIPVSGVLFHMLLRCHLRCRRAGTTVAAPPGTILRQALMVPALFPPAPSQPRAESKGKRPHRRAPRPVAARPGARPATRRGSRHRAKCRGACRWRGHEY